MGARAPEQQLSEDGASRRVFVLLVFSAPQQTSAQDVQSRFFFEKNPF